MRIIGCRKPVNAGLAIMLLVALLVGIPGRGGAQLVVNCPGQSLQQAINTAGRNMTITVNGTCPETLYINDTKVGLVLDGRGTAIIQPPQPSQHALTIAGSYVSVKGFTVTNANVCIEVNGSQYVTIDGNTLENSVVGISLGAGSEVRIVNNDIRDNSTNGINIYENASAYIGYRHLTPSPEPNIIRDNGQIGIVVDKSSTAFIIGNKIIGNSYDGILVQRVSQATIANNIINSNGTNGVRVSHNSQVDFGSDSGKNLWNLPNKTTSNNGQWGIHCSLGAVIDGRRGTLMGTNGALSPVVSGCINSTKP